MEDSISDEFPVIWLVGMPASGKSTFGRVLANKLNRKLIDTDSLIESKYQTTIPAIFKDKGEDFFRLAENEIVTELDPTEPKVVATGGGLPCFHDNMDLLLRKGVVVFLEVSATVLADRVLKAKGKRPLLPQEEKESLITELESKLQIRSPFYQKANITLTYPKISVDALIDKLSNFSKI